MPAVDFQRLFETSPNAYMLLDRELRYVTANPSYLRLTSSRLEDLVGRPLFDVFPHDPRDPNNESARRLRASLERVLATRAPDVIALIPYHVPRSDAPEHAREVRYWSATHTPILDDDGEVALILQHTSDVTDLHRVGGVAEAQAVIGRARAIEDTNLHLRRLFEQAPGFVAILRGPEHVYELANAAYQALVGGRDVVGRTVRDALPEVAGQGFFELLDRVYASGATYVGRAVQVRLARGAVLEDVYVDFVYQPIVEAGGAVGGIFVLGHDVTEQVRAEAEQRFLADAIPQQVWTATPDGLLDSVNLQSETYFGLSREALLAEGWQAVVHPDDLRRTLERWRGCLETGEPYEIDFRLRRGDGVYRWHLGRAFAMRGGDGAIAKWFGTNTDVDDARRARDELEHRAAYEQQLIGIVSHDLRNPLNAITIAATLLHRSNLDDKQRATVARVARAGQRAARLIDDFLDFTQARTGRMPIRPARANLREIVRAVVAEVEAGNPGRATTVELDGDLAGTWDADRLAQAIGNLVGNAFQHGAPGTPVRVRAADEGAEVSVAIQNDGPAIPEAGRARLFEPFLRGEGAGTASGRSVGLGLYIARAIVEAHGGRIEVDSADDRGTTFTVRLPR